MTQVLSILLQDFCGLYSASTAPAQGRRFLSHTSGADCQFISIGHLLEGQDCACCFLRGKHGPYCDLYIHWRPTVRVYTVYWCECLLQIWTYLAPLAPTSTPQLARPEPSATNFASCKSSLPDLSIATWLALSNIPTAFNAGKECSDRISNTTHINGPSFRALVLLASPSPPSAILSHHKTEKVFLAGTGACEV